MGGFQNDLWSHAGVVGFFPTTRTQAPTVASGQSRKLIFRSRRAEVVALLTRKLQKRVAHDRADGMNSTVPSPCMTKTIPVVSSEGRVAAGFQIFS